MPRTPGRNLSPLFNLAYALFAIAYLPIFLVKIKQAASGRELIKQRLGFLPSVPQGRKVWVHAVSVGEVMAVRRFITEFLNRFPDCHVILTTVTPTGQKVAKEMEGPRVHAFYFPFDFRFACRRFFQAFQPECLILAETEIWPNLLLEAERQGVPTGIINARLSEKSSRRYGKFQFLFRPLFEKLSFVLAQTEKDAERFIALGVSSEKVRTLGNMKYDQVLNPVSQDAAALRAKWNIPIESPVLIAGSTHPGEEEILFRIFIPLQKQFPGLKMIVAPRHIERAKEIQTLGERLGFSVRLSASQDDASWEILILNQIGILKNLYQIADAVFVGGSFVPKGGQNPIEPAVLRKPVLHGPHTFNFEQVYEWLDRQKGSVLVRTEQELLTWFQRLFASETERRAYGEAAFFAIQAFQGATERHLEYLASHLIPERNHDVEINTRLFPPAGGRV